jgi:ABC-type phosphate/phosphonate transport system permease subunit
VTLVLPALAGADPSLFGASDETVAQAASGFGLAGLIAGIVACLRETRATPKWATGEPGRTRDWLAKRVPRVRRAILLSAATVAGPCSS